MNLKHTNNFVQKLTRSFINPLNFQFNKPTQCNHVDSRSALYYCGTRFEAKWSCLDSAHIYLLNDIDARKDQLEDLYKKSEHHDLKSDSLTLKSKILL